jgi:sulfoxide reductase heme-binding subunit YedZ
MRRFGFVASARNFRFTPLQILVHLAAWALVAWLAWDYMAGNLTVNPIQAATQRTGRYAITFLVLSLACMPLYSLFGFRQLLTVRRTLGLYAFSFAATHLYIFLGIDYGFDLGLLKADLLSKRYILAGAATMLILIPLAVTSFKWCMRLLGKNWKRLHRLVYLAGILAVFHYGWAKKGDLFRLQGDMALPIFYGVLVTILLAMRLPAVRRGITKMRGRLKTNKTIMSQT